jgi:hypothetical protein
MIVAIRQLQQRMLEQLDELSTRDRNLLTGLLLFGGFATTGFITWTLTAWLADAASRVEVAKEKLQASQELRAEYMGVLQQIDAAEARLAQMKARSVSAFVEDLANRAAVKENLQAANETESQVVGQFRQSSYKVELKGAPLGGVVAFLHNIETSDFPVRVESARLRGVSMRPEKKIDLSLELISYSLEETEK